MSSNQTTSRRWWHKQQPRGNEPENAAGFSNEDAAEVEPPKTVASMTQDELRQMITETVERTLEDLLPKQLARQRSMLESELKWHLGDLMKEAAAMNGAGAVNVAASQQEPQEVPKINTSIDWSFLE